MLCQFTMSYHNSLPQCILRLESVAWGSLLFCICVEETSEVLIGDPCIVLSTTGRESIFDDVMVHNLIQYVSSVHPQTELWI